MGQPLSDIEEQMPETAAEGQIINDNQPDSARYSSHFLFTLLI
jgi:hypothetical protein